MKRVTPLLAMLWMAGCATEPRFSESEPQWRSLFDGQTLGNWASASFGGEGEVYVEDGAIVMSMGSPMTGVTWQGAAPMQVNYEIQFDAMRTLGNDFFCALTFPVDEAFCTLILSGWAGAVVGLSNINHADASQNETTTFMSFHNERWYHVRLRVEQERIAAWIDGEQIIDADIRGKQVTIRPEVERAKPLGFSAWTSEGRIKNIRWRPLPQAD